MTCGSAQGRLDSNCAAWPPTRHQERTNGTARHTPRRSRGGAWADEPDPAAMLPATNMPTVWMAPGSLALLRGAARTAQVLRHCADQHQPDQEHGESEVEPRDRDAHAERGDDYSRQDLALVPIGEGAECGEGEAVD